MAYTYLEDVDGCALGCEGLDDTLGVPAHTRIRVARKWIDYGLTCRLECSDLRAWSATLTE